MNKKRYPFKNRKSIYHQAHIQVFTRWCNSHLRFRQLEIPAGHLTTGSLDDGSILWHLLSQLSGKTLPKMDPPKSRTHKILNLGVSLKFLEESHIKLVAIGAEDILDHVNKLILGLIWTIILRFQICASLPATPDHSDPDSANKPAPPVQNTSIVEAKKQLLSWLQSMGVESTKLSDWFSFLCFFSHF